MHSTYRIFGLNIASVIPLPARPVLHLQPEIVPDVTIEYGETPTTLADPRFKGIRFQAGSEGFLLKVDGIARYHVRNGRRITITPEDGSGGDDVLVFLMGSAMGALLHQRNVLVLHAAAVSVNGGIVIFTGPSGIGKSTLAAGLHRRGYHFLADDMCAIKAVDGHPAVIPGFTQLKLWADCLTKLNTDENTLKSVRQGKGLKKYFLPIEGIPDTPLPLKSVFALETTNTDRLEITELKGGEKIDPIIDNTYRLRFLEGLGGKIEHFKQCAVVAAKTAVYRTVRPNKGFLLNDLMDLVEVRFLP